MNLIEQTREHLLRTLESGCEETRNVPYRYEHSLRVAAVGREIARAEGFDEEAMVLACLLHDIGYARCRTPEEYDRHGALSADMAREWLTENGYDPEYGARPVKRLIQRELVNQLAKEILEGKIRKDSKIVVDCKDGETILRNS